VFKMSAISTHHTGWWHVKCNLGLPWSMTWCWWARSSLVCHVLLTQESFLDLLQTFSIFSHDMPKICHFSLFTDFSKSLSTPAVSITQLFVFLAVHDTLRTCRKLFISTAFVGSLRQSLTSSSHIYMLLPAISRSLGWESLFHSA